MAQKRSFVNTAQFCLCENPIHCWLSMKKTALTDETKTISLRTNSNAREQIMINRASDILRGRGAVNFK